MSQPRHYQRSPVGLVTSLMFSVALTAVLFGTLPFAHRVATPERSLELRKTSAVELPPPVQEEAPPPPLLDRPPEAAPEPQLVETPQQIPLSVDLEVAMGAGGALARFGESLRALTAVETSVDDVFDAADLEKRPEAVAQTPPTYPPELRKARIEGVVTLVFVLGEDGRVEDPRVESSSRPEFEKPALEAIRKWRFRPGEKDGQAVRTYVRIPMRFRVSSS